MRDIVHLELRVDGVMICQLDHLLESIINEDEANKGGETFFSEAGEVLDQEAGVSGDEDETQEGWPKADPEAKLQVVKIIVSATRQGWAGRENVRVREIHAGSWLPSKKWWTTALGTCAHLDSTGVFQELSSPLSASQLHKCMWCNLIAKVAEKHAEVVSLPCASTNECYQWIQPLPRLPSKNPPLANTHRAAKAPQHPRAAQSRQPSTSRRQNHSLRISFRKVISCQPSQSGACVFISQALALIKRNQNTSRRRSRSTKQKITNAGARGMMERSASFLPGKCVCPGLLYPDGAESKGRLSGQNKFENTTPEQIRPCQGGYCLLWVSNRRQWGQQPQPHDLPWKPESGLSIRIQTKPLQGFLLAVDKILGRAAAFLHWQTDLEKG